MVNDEHRGILEAPYSVKEVKEALFSILGNEAPHLYGFGSYFYKEVQKIVGNDIIDALLDFFREAKLLKEINSIGITLIHKSKCPDNMSDFRLISCCDVINKCITNVLCNN